MNPMNFLLGILLAKDLEPRDKVLTGMLCGFTRMPAAPLLVKPVADKVTEQAKQIQENEKFFSELGARTLDELRGKLKDDSQFRQTFANNLNIIITIKERQDGSTQQAMIQQSEQKKTT